MDIYVFKDNQHLGPYSLDILKEYYLAKHISKTDLICYDGNNWIQLHQFDLFYGEEVEIPKNIKPKGQTRAGTAYDRGIVLNDKINRITSLVTEFMASSGKLKRRKCTLNRVVGRLSFGYQSVGLCFELFDHDINKTLVVITTETNENLELFYLVPQLIISYYKDGSTIDQEAWKKSQRKDAYIFIGGICLIFLVLGLIVYFLI